MTDPNDLFELNRFLQECRDEAYKDIYRKSSEMISRSPPYEHNYRSRSPTRKNSYEDNYRLNSPYYSPNRHRSRSPRRNTNSRSRSPRRSFDKLEQKVHENDATNHRYIQSIEELERWVDAEIRHKRKDLIERALMATIKCYHDASKKHGINNVKNFSYVSYRIQIYNVSPHWDMGIGNKISWNKGGYYFKKSSSNVLVPQNHKIISLLKQVNRMTGDHVQFAMRRWDLRNKSWTFLIEIRSIMKGELLKRFHLETDPKYTYSIFEDMIQIIEREIKKKMSGVSFNGICGRLANKIVFGFDADIVKDFAKHMEYHGQFGNILLHRVTNDKNNWRFYAISS